MNGNYEMKRTAGLSRNQGNSESNFSLILLLRMLGLALFMLGVAIPVSTAYAVPPATGPQPGGPTLDLDTFTPPAFCAGPLQVQGVDAFVCEFPFNWVFEEASLAQFATTEFGVTIQAVGGHGGDGGSTLGGTVGAGAGGAPGLAQTTLRGDALASKSLYIYVGNNGSFGIAGKGGNGGAATVVATAALAPQPESLVEILVTAEGGGGGQGFAGSTRCVENPADLNQNFVDISCAGGDGGVAIGIDVQNRFGFGRMGATPPPLAISLLQPQPGGLY